MSQCIPARAHIRYAGNDRVGHSLLSLLAEGYASYLDGESQACDEELRMTCESVRYVPANRLACAETASLFIGGAAVIDSGSLTLYATASVFA